MHSPLFLANRCHFGWTRSNKNESKSESRCLAIGCRFRCLSRTLSGEQKEELFCCVFAAWMGQSIKFSNTWNSTDNDNTNWFMRPFDVLWTTKTNEVPQSSIVWHETDCHESMCCGDFSASFDLNHFVVVVVVVQMNWSGATTTTTTTTNES